MYMCVHLLVISAPQFVMMLYNIVSEKDLKLRQVSIFV